MTTDLPDFLLQRIAEDEAVARAVSTSDWDATLDGRFIVLWNDNNPLAEHVARHDPARVLAEVAAKRAIANLHAEVTGSTAFYGDDIETPHGSPACPTCGTWGEYAVAWPCPTLRILAQPYADHADYEQAWAL